LWDKDVRAGRVVVHVLGDETDDLAWAVTVETGDEFCADDIASLQLVWRHRISGGEWQIVGSGIGRSALEEVLRLLLLLLLLRATSWGEHRSAANCR
jgi:hypothetical protein